MPALSRPRRRIEYSVRGSGGVSFGGFFLWNEGKWMGEEGGGNLLWRWPRSRWIWLGDTFLLLVEETIGWRASCYWEASERRRNMVWISCGKLDGVFRYALPVYCQRSGNDHAGAPVILRLGRKQSRYTVLGLGLGLSNLACRENF